jgi:hypothetical protein
MVEGDIEGGEELFVEGLDELGLDVAGVDVLEGAVEHLEQGGVVVLVVGFHALYTHAVDDFEFGVGVGPWQGPLEVAVVVDEEVFLVGEGFGIDRT